MTNKQFALKGTRWNGQSIYYTGRAGEGWVSPNKGDAFTYQEQLAKGKCAQFNGTSAMHGYVFSPEEVE